MIKEKFMSVKCKTCGSVIEKKSYKKYGVILLISCIPMFPLLMGVAYGTIIPFLYALLSGIIGFYFIFKKDKYFYFCRKCKIKVPYPAIDHDLTD